mmetsp:Transcript_46415/g.140568  ORF Transcript_46415/g.140568 Transcript_46415/m.140568 type:complete len:201 (-) Transcript_46415:923-1525(-)
MSHNSCGLDQHLPSQVPFDVPRCIGQGPPVQRPLRRRLAQRREQRLSVGPRRPRGRHCPSTARGGVARHLREHPMALESESAVERLRHRPRQHLNVQPRYFPGASAIVRLQRPKGGEEIGGVEVIFPLDGLEPVKIGGGPHQRRNGVDESQIAEIGGNDSLVRIIIIAGSVAGQQRRVKVAGGMQGSHKRWVVRVNHSHV